MKKRVTLKEHLMNLGAKKSFFKKKIVGTEFRTKKPIILYTSKIDFKGGDLSFISNSLASKMKIWSSSFSLRYVFPKKKIIKMGWRDDRDDSRPQCYEYYYENGTFEDAIDNHKKFGVDIERAKQNLIKKYEKGSAAHSNASWGWESTEIDFEAICKKNNLVRSRGGGPPFRREMNEAYFHHEEYLDIQKLDFSYSEFHANFFLLREIIKYSRSISNRIYFADVRSLEFVDDIYVEI